MSKLLSLDLKTLQDSNKPLELRGKTIESFMPMPSKHGVVNDFYFIFTDGSEAHFGASSEGAIVCVIEDAGEDASPTESGAEEPNVQAHRKDGPCESSESTQDVDAQPVRFP